MNPTAAFLAQSRRERGQVGGRTGRERRRARPNGIGQKTRAHSSFFCCCCGARRSMRLQQPGQLSPTLTQGWCRPLAAPCPTREVHRRSPESICHRGFLLRSRGRVWAVPLQRATTGVRRAGPERWSPNTSTRRPEAHPTDAKGAC